MARLTKEDEHGLGAGKGTDVNQFIRNLKGIYIERGGYSEINFTCNTYFSDSTWLLTGEARTRLDFTTSYKSAAIFATLHGKDVLDSAKSSPYICRYAESQIHKLKDNG